MAVRKPGLIALFDVDGTLTAPRKEVTSKMFEFMRELRKVVTVGVVGGSDLSKISEQLGKTVTTDYDYVFSENGLVAHKDGKLIGTQSMKAFVGDGNLKEFINFTLHYIADLDIPIKRGTFIEFRSGMINVSPIGRNCSQEERDEFEKYDKVHNIRPKMVSVLREKFQHLNLTFSIGGQISFDVFPQGWDKTYCLRYLQDFNEIHFFGDKTYKGGNDHEIYESDRTLGHTENTPGSNSLFHCWCACSSGAQHNAAVLGAACSSSAACATCSSASCAKCSSAVLCRCLHADRHGSAVLPYKL
ncbi:phosphomannomutase isoform X2 [Euphorbia lathyris]|uniref:phosphomannomutase isoform X2 n=1 Tax=Euphorbia lathyris TaxID=212925 RepID=UPI003313BC0C